MFSIDDQVYVLLDASDEAIDFTSGKIRGQVFTVIDVDLDTYLNVCIGDFGWSWWVNSSALSLEKEDTDKTPIERKIAFMHNRWVNRKGT